MANEQQCASAGSCGRSSCSGCPSAGGKPVDMLEKLHEGSQVKKVIAVVSGKGGVGKSLVTSLLASAVQRQGKRAAVLDADITGPSMCKAFGINAKAAGDKDLIYPIITATGLQVISCNMFLPHEDQPVVWRGPIIAGMVKQFWTDVFWDEVDYMFVDMPPGTGDVPLTVYQSLPIDGIVIVTSPQELVSMIVAKAVNMANLMNVPIIGLVENYSYFHCPDNGKDYKIFGESHLEETAEKYALPILARLPIDPALAQASDDGRIEYVEVPQLNDCVKAVML